MSYNKQTWETGEVITASKLNHMEDGIADSGSGGGVLVLHATEGTLDKTAGEIINALQAGMLIFINYYYPADEEESATAVPQFFAYYNEVIGAEESYHDFAFVSFYYDSNDGAGITISNYTAADLNSYPMAL